MNIFKFLETTTEISKFEEIFNFDFGLDNPKLQLFINKCIEVVFVLFMVLLLCKVIDLITKRIRKRMTKRKTEKSIANLVYNILNKGLKVMVIFAAVGCLGIDTTSVVGLFTATGLGIGLAIQGALANFAGGFLILTMRPFKVDDYISCQSTEGTVEDIRLFYTYLRTVDNKLVMIPNGSLISGVVVNYSSKETRRVDITFSIDYEASYSEAEKIILDCVSKHSKVLSDPASTCRIGKWSESSIDLVLKAWVKNADYWDVMFDLLEDVYDALNKNNIKIPYNQLEISYRNATAMKEQEKH